MVFHAFPIVFLAWAGYFVQRKALKVVFHLLDAGLCELMPADRELWRLLAQARRSDYELVVVLTKAEKSGIHTISCL